MDNSKLIGELRDHGSDMSNEAADLIERLEADKQELWAWLEKQRPATEFASSILDGVRNVVQGAGNFTARIVASLERQRPLCPDHRDKARDYYCLLCEIEKLTRERDEARELAKVLARRGEATVAEYDAHSWLEEEWERTNTGG